MQAACKLRLKHEANNTQVKDAMLIGALSVIPMEGSGTASSGRPMSIPNEEVRLVNPLFEPFCKPGLVLAPDGREHPIHVLRDTAALQSVIRES